MLVQIPLKVVDDLVKGKASMWLVRWVLLLVFVQFKRLSYRRVLTELAPLLLLRRLPRIEIARLQVVTELLLNRLKVNQRLTHCQQVTNKVTLRKVLIQRIKLRVYLRQVRVQPDLDQRLFGYTNNIQRDVEIPRTLVDLPEPQKGSIQQVQSLLNRHVSNLTCTDRDALDEQCRLMKTAA